MVLTIALLPAINAVFDWLSYGFTLWLLQYGQKRGGVWPLLSGFADVAVALVLFAGLSAALVSVLSLINAWRGAVLVDVHAILTDPGGHLWVIAMVGSTLVPTLVHLGLGLFSLITWIPLELWKAWARRLDSDDSLYGALAASGLLSALLILVYGGSLVLVGAMLWWLWAHGGWIIERYLDWLWWLAQYLSGGVAVLT